MKGLRCTFYFLLTINFSAHSQYSLFRENDKVGLKDPKGQIVIPADYESLGWSDGTFSIIDKVIGYQKKGFWGLINVDNRIITKTDFTGITPGEALMLVAYKKANYAAQSSAGCILTSGKEIIPFEYDGLKVSSFRAIAFKKISNQLRYGLIDLTNKKLIPMEYKSIYSIGSLRFGVENFQNKTALFAETGKQITDFLIDSISSFHKNYAVIYQNLKQGLMDRDGQIKIEPKYRAIQIQDDGTILAHQPDEWNILTADSQLLQKIQADSIEGVEKNIFKLRVADFIQLVDSKFQLISQRSFSSLDKFENNKAVFGVSGKYGIIRKNGTVLIEPLYDKLISGATYYLGNQCKVGRDQWAILDSLGNKKHSKHYDEIQPFNGIFFPAKNKNFWGALDANGKEIIACVHDSLLQTQRENVVVKFHGQYGVIDIKENWIVTPQPYKLTLIADDRYLEMTGKTTFLKSFDGNVVYFTDNKLDIFPKYLIEHLASGGVWQVDLNGRIQSHQVYALENIEGIFPESEGLRAIKKNGKFGFIDSRGRLRIANRYEDVKSFSQQLAAIKITDRWGFINHEDKIAIQPVYDEVTSFQNGVSIVKLKNLYGAINKEGKLVLPARYEKLAVLQSARILLVQDGLKGLADTNGKLLINCKFNALQDLNNGYLIVGKDKKYSLLTLQGVSTIPMIYDYIIYDEFNDRYAALKKSGWITITP
jgi:hypothetical protein